MIDQEHFRNYFGHGCTIAALKNEISKSIWETIGVELLKSLETSENIMDRDRYYEFNRRLAETLDKFIEILGVRTTVNKTNIPLDRIDQIKEMELHRMSRMIADSIFKTHFISYKEINDPRTPLIEYQVEVPFLRIVAQPTKGDE